MNTQAKRQSPKSWLPALLERAAPVLIGGSPRSGTTLLLSILSAHPSILAIPREMWGFYPTMSEEEFATMMRRFYRQLRKQVERLQVPSTCTRWCEKTPNNVREFGKLLRFFEPTPKLIHIVRDGRDVVTSIHPSRSDEYWVPVDQWTWEVRCGLEWRHHPRVHTLRYEDLVTDPVRTLESLCDFLGEDLDDRLFHWQEHATVRSAPAWRDKVRPLSATSIGRWHDPRHRSVIEEFRCNEDAMCLLQELGYSV